jgi:hypothetical protein
MAQRRVSPPTAPLTIDRRGGWRLLGISERHFVRFEAAGLVKPTTPAAGRRPARYDVAELVQAFVKWKVGSVEPARDRRDRSQAEWLELKLARERLELLPRDQVIREGRAFVAATMAKLRALPSRMVRAGMIDAAAQPDVAALLREVQGEIDRWTSLLDLRAAALNGDAPVRDDAKVRA